MYLFIYLLAQNRIYFLKNYWFIDLFILTKQNLYINFLSQNRIYLFPLTKQNLFIDLCIWHHDRTWSGMLNFEVWKVWKFYFHKMITNMK